MITKQINQSNSFTKPSSQNNNKDNYTRGNFFKKALLLTAVSATVFSGVLAGTPSDYKANKTDTVKSNTEVVAQENDGKSIVKENKNEKKPLDGISIACFMIYAASMAAITGYIISKSKSK